MAVALVLAAALVFTNAFSAGQVADNARAQHWVNATTGSAALVRAATAQAVFFGIDLDLGVASESGAERARLEAQLNLDQLVEWMSSAEEQSSIDTTLVMEKLDRYASSIQDVLGALEAGDALTALELNSGQAETEFNAAKADLVVLRDSIIERIASTEASAGWIAGITRFLITLLIPAAALILYRRMVHRQALAGQLTLEAKLEAERDLRLSKDEFIASISHELRTPLTSIYGFSEVLVESGLVDPESATELVGLIHSESAELSRMVEDLLTAARLDAQALTLDVEEFDLIEELETVLAPARRHGAAIVLEAEPLRMLTDRHRLRQIVRNLVTNAVKYGGPTIRVVVETTDSEWLLLVADDGAGVPPDIEDRLFEKFVHKASAALLVGSVGLGLAVARSIAQLMDGDLDYRRVDGETHFSVRLPLSSCVAVPARESTDVDGSPGGHTSHSGQLASASASVAEISRQNEVPSR
ncbi:MAG: HAMP domain-containing histidine kinase [Acidimicrobiia bacterium]|nr:HAMP domain-containing histidine kinase [Acidimicrobiia bacterium]